MEETYPFLRHSVIESTAKVWHIYELHEPLTEKALVVNRSNRSDGIREGKQIAIGRVKRIS